MKKIIILTILICLLFNCGGKSLPDILKGAWIIEAIHERDPYRRIVLFLPEKLSDSSDYYKAIMFSRIFEDKDWAHDGQVEIVTYKILNDKKLRFWNDNYSFEFKKDKLLNLYGETTAYDLKLERIKKSQSNQILQFVKKLFENPDEMTENLNSRIRSEIPWDELLLNQDEFKIVKYRVYLENGSQYFKKAQFDNSIDEFSKAIKMDPLRSKAYPYRARAYIFKGKNHAAIKDFEKAIALDPDESTYYWEKASIYRDLDDLDNAFSDINKAIELNPSQSRYYSTKGGFYAKKGEYDKAINECNTALKLNGNDAFAFQSRGYAYLKKGEIDIALSNLRRAIRLDRDILYAYFYIAQALELKQNYKDAIEYYKIFIDGSKRYYSYTSNDVSKAKTKIKELKTKMAN